MTHTVRYTELTPAEFRERLEATPVAYLPLGTLEWHGEHLPLGSDGIQARGFFELVAEQVGGIVLPMLFLGPDTREVHAGTEYFGMDNSFDDDPHQLMGSAYWVDDDLFDDILSNVLRQLSRAGFKIVVAHGHAPSTHHWVQHAEEWEEAFGLELFACWREDESELSDGLGMMTDHAAANETSWMMALRPALVEADELPEDPDEWPTGIGGEDPREHASQARGRNAITAQADRMTTLLEEAVQKLD